MEKQALSFDPDKTRAVLIATTKTSDANLEILNHPERDVKAFKDVLVNPKIVGIPDDNILTLVDTPVTKTVTECADFAEAAADTLLIYYAGHGLISKDNSSELLLATCETRLKHKDTTSVPFKTLNRIMKGSKAKKKILILDCCYSGKAIRSVMGPSIAGDAFVICSAAPNDPSTAPKGKAYSTFTSALLTILRGGLPHVDSPSLTLKQIFVALHEKLEDPEPQSQAANSGADIVFAHNSRNVQEVPAPKQPENSGQQPQRSTNGSISEGQRAAREEALRLGREQILRKERRKARWKALGLKLQVIPFILLCLVIAALPLTLLVLPKDPSVLSGLATLTFVVYGMLMTLILVAYVAKWSRITPLANIIFALNRDATETATKKAGPLFLAFLIGIVVMVLVTILGKLF